MIPNLKLNLNLTDSQWYHQRTKSVQDENVPVIRITFRRDGKRLGANIAGTIRSLDQAHCVRDRAGTSRSEEYKSRSITIRGNGAVLSRNRTVHHRRYQYLFTYMEYSGRRRNLESKGKNANRREGVSTTQRVTTASVLN